VEQQDKRLAEPLRSESIKWACDVLGLDSQVCEESRKSASRHTVGAFFASLKSNGFFVESDKIEAVEMALENPVANAPQFLKHLSQQGFQRTQKGFGSLDKQSTEKFLMQTQPS